MSKIMLAEDDNNLREIYEARLQAEGYTIVAAKDGEEALVIAKAEKPDLIIADVMMPKISGFEMLDILRNTDGLKDVKVIMLTALGQSDDQKRADLLGADRYLVKSQVTLEDIVKVAHELLQDGSSAAAAPAAPTALAPPAEAAPAAPAPAPADPPSNDTALAQPTDGGVAQSTAQEETVVEGQIENFVAGATEDQSNTAAIPVSDDTPAAQPTTDSSNDSSDDNSAADDKLMADAVDAFAANTSSTDAPAPASDPASTPEEPEAKPEPSDAPQAAAEDTEAEPADAAEVKSDDAESDDESSPFGSVPIARKKVITPPDNEPKKDLDELLAIETAKELNNAPPAAPTPVVATNEGGIQSESNTPPAGSAAQTPATPTTTVAPSDPNDPSSISL